MKSQVSQEWTHLICFNLFMNQFQDINFTSFFVFLFPRHNNPLIPVSCSDQDWAGPAVAGAEPEVSGEHVLVQLRAHAVGAGLARGGLGHGAVLVMVTHTPWQYSCIIIRWPPHYVTCGGSDPSAGCEVRSCPASVRVRSVGGQPRGRGHTGRGRAALRLAPGVAWGEVIITIIIIIITIYWPPWLCMGVSTPGALCEVRGAA